jgi:hypothetical protein
MTAQGDSAHGTSPLRAQLHADHTLVIKPPPVPQIVPGGFTIDDFRIDPQVVTLGGRWRPLAERPIARLVAKGKPVKYSPPSRPTAMGASDGQDVLVVSCPVALPASHCDQDTL